MQSAHYFPVEPKPFAMRAGLIKFPTDFGNGEADHRIFQVDGQLERALHEKRAPRVVDRYFEGANTPAEARALDAALTLAEGHLHADAPERLEAARADVRAKSRWDALARAVQEDLVVMHAGESGQGKALLLHVSFPSGWHPERLLHQDFLGIHQPVPSFPGRDGDPKAAAAAESMMRSMIERGPYVRFVWTVRADDALDHHPVCGGRREWTYDSPGYLRVERQLTLPLPQERASLFVIRTYVTAFSALRAEERATLRTAVLQMPEAYKSYKGIPHDAAVVLRALDG